MKEQQAGPRAVAAALVELTVKEQQAGPLAVAMFVVVKTAFADIECEGREKRYKRAERNRHCIPVMSKWMTPVV